MRTHANRLTHLTATLAVATALLLAAPAVMAQIEPQTVEVAVAVGPSTPTSGDGVVPVEWSGNPSCQELGYAYGFKIEGQGGAAYAGTFYLNSSYGVLTGGAPEDTVNYLVLSSDGTHLSWTSTLPLDLVFMKGGNGGNAYTYVPEDTADTGLGTPDSGPALSHVEFCYDYELVVSKTAAGSFDRVYTWDIEKGPDGDYDLNIGDPAVTHGYTVTVDQTVADGNFAVAGAITITNPSPLAATIASVVDVLDDGTPVTVDCGVTFPHTLAGGASLVCGYTASPDDASATLNTATVTTTGAVPGATATAAVAFAMNVVGYPEINVADTNGQTFGPVTGDASWSYDRSFSCSANPADYAGGPYGYDHLNTATITETGASDTANVRVDCYAPTVTKNASATLDRTHEWTITKEADGSYTGFIGDPATTHRYSITVTKTGSTDSSRRVEGSIYVSNPGPVAMTLQSVVDSVGGVPAVVTCPSLVVPALGTLECTYVATDGLTGDETLNTATATLLNGIAFTGTAQFSYTVHDVNAEVNVIDAADGEASRSFGPFDGTATFTYDHDFRCSANPADYTEGVSAATRVNTATIVETGASDDATVTLTCYAPTVTKTAAATLDREYSWTITKDADATYDEFIGDPAHTHPYSITVTRTGSTDSNWRVIGSIFVFNPAPIPMPLSGVSDAVEGVSAAVTCPGYTVAAGGTLECTYDVSAGLDGDESLNTATATLNGIGFNGTAQFEYTANEITASISVTDTADGEAPRTFGPVSDTTTFIYDQDFQCSGNPADYAGGGYTTTRVNTATIDQTGDSDDATVILNCYAPTVTKDAAASFDREFSWTIEKSVDPATHSGFIGDSFSSGYTVTVDRTTTDSNFMVRGTITVSNPNPGKAMTVSVADVVGGVPANLVCGGTLTIPASGSNTCTYDMTLASKTDGTNTATVTLNGVEFSASAAYAFGEPTSTTGYAEISVGDTQEDSTAPWAASDDEASWTYTGDFECPTDVSLYATGPYTLTVTNIATITETGQSADASVEVVCFAPTVSKTVAPAWEELYDWEIAKHVDSTSFAGFAGDRWDFDYDVDVTLVSRDERGFSASGTISVTNPHPTLSLQVGLTDAIGSFSGTITEGCSYAAGILTIPANTTANCGYTVDMGDDLDGQQATPFTNVATATYRTSTFTGSASFTFGDVEPTLAEGSEPAEVVAVDDDASPLDTGDDHRTSTLTDTTADAITYSQGDLCPTDVTMYTGGEYTLTLTNTAILEDTEESDSTEVTVTCYAPTVTKTVAPAWQRFFNWQIAKNVDHATFAGFAGDPWQFAYDIDVTLAEYDELNFTASGVITVANPHPTAALTVALTDAVGAFNGTITADADCIFDGANLTVPAGGTATCGYTVDMGDELDDGQATTHTNIATATYRTATFTGSASFTFGDVQPTLASGSEPAEVTATDDNATAADPTDDRQSAAITATTENAIAYTQGDLCPTDAAMYSNGVYTLALTNVAILDQTGDSDTETVTVTCYAPTVTKDVTPAWEADYDWTIFKNVDGTTFVGFVGDEWLFTYDVDVVLDAYDELNFAASGTITVTNPHPEAALTVALTDAIGAFNGTIAADADCILDGANLTVPAGGTATCDYTVDMGDELDDQQATAFTNTATATYLTASFTGTASFTFGDVDPALAEGSEPAEVTATDDNASPGVSTDDHHSETLADTTANAIAYTQGDLCPTDLSMYSNGVYELTLTNLAKLDQTMDQDTETVTITCHVPAKAKVVKFITAGPEDIGQFQIEFELYDPDDHLVETASLYGSDFSESGGVVSGEVTFAEDLQTAGTWKVVEVLPDGWVSDLDPPVECSIPVAFPGSANQTYTCTFENTEMSRVDLIKLTNGTPTETQTWSFSLFDGPDGFGDIPIVSDTTPPALLEFPADPGPPPVATDLDPYATYTVCELGVPAGYTSFWRIDVDGDEIGDVTVIPYNPNAADSPQEDLGNRCVDFGAGTGIALVPGTTLHFIVDNQYPGGAPRTPGYWKNWNRCTGGGQQYTADANGSYLEGFWLLEDVLAPAMGDGITWDDILSDDFLYPIDGCAIAVDILDKRVVTNPDLVGDGKKVASDPLHNLATHLLAAELNLGAGACEPSEPIFDGTAAWPFRDLVIEAERLLDTYNFDNEGHDRLPKNSPDAARANWLASALDQYNNGLFCGDGE